MKETPTLQEAIYIEGLPEWYTNFTPADFWTGEAFALFDAARRAGIIAFDTLTYSWTAGRNYPKGALAYFCQKASKCLHLNKGAHTYWKPFETMFNPGGLCWPDDAADTRPEYRHRPAAPLRLSLHNLDESAGQEALRSRIDSFFESYAPAAAGPQRR